MMTVKRFQRMVGILAVLHLGCLTSARAQDGDYEELVQRNLELRQEIQALEDKYTSVESERNVLIQHIRDLQNEKDSLRQTLDELKAGPGEIPKFISQNLKLNKTLEEALARNDRLGKEMEDLKKEILLLKGDRAEALKMLEIERDDSARKLQRAEEDLSAAQEALRAYGGAPSGEEGLSATAEQTPPLPQEQPLEEKASEVRQASGADLGEEELKERLAAARQTFEMEKRKLISQNETFIKILEEQKASLEEELEMARKASGEKEDVDKGARAPAKGLEKKRISSEAKKVRTLEGDLAAARKVYAQKEEEWRQEKKDLVSKQKEAQQGSKDILKQKDAADKKVRELEKDREALKAEAAALEEKWNAAETAKKEAQTSLRKVLAENQALGKKAASDAVSVPSKKKKKEAGKAAVFPKDKQLLDMHYNLALSYNRTGMHAQERDEYLACLKIDPRDANVHYNLAVLYDDNLNDNRKAIHHYREYLEIRPNAEDSMAVREWILHAEEEDRIGAQMR